MSDKKCLGCGCLLQDENILKEGYTTSLTNDYCQRCFKIRNYGEYKQVKKSNSEYIEILKKINDTKDLVLYVTDILNLEENFNKLKEIVHNKMILVLNKYDCIDRSISEDKLIDYIKKIDDTFIDVIVVSASKNTNMDKLLNKIKYYQTSNNVYVIGYTNAGKSSLINRIIKNYSDNVDNVLTESPIPSTTLNTIEIRINDYLTIIDTPGIVDDNSILNYVDKRTLNKINNINRIKPKSYPIKKGQIIVVDDIFRIDYLEGDRNNFIFFMSNRLKISKFFRDKDILKDKMKIELDVGYNYDIVIKGLGFIKVVNKCKINLYIDKQVDIYLRRSMI